MSHVIIHPGQAVSSVRKDGELVNFPIVLGSGKDWIYLTDEDIRAVVKKYEEILNAQRAKRDTLTEATFPTEPGMYIRTDDIGLDPPRHIFVLMRDGRWTTAAGTGYFDRGTVLSHHRKSPLVRLGVVNHD